jgi:glycerate dehydrogenase
MTSRSDDRPARIVFLDRGTLSPQARLRAPGFPHEMVVYDRTTPDQVAERIAGADVLITNKVPLRRDAIRAADRLRLIAVAATGTDVVDLEACAGAGITVTNIRDYAVHTVPEHTFALILALRRSILAYRDSVARGRWQEAGQFCYFDYPVHDLAGSTLGVIGDGSIGQAVAELGKAFGMRTLFSAYKGTTGMGPLYTPFEELLRISDVITLHAPLMPSTRGMIGRAEFALMERRPLLINTARGGLVEETALEEALTSGQISGVRRRDQRAAARRSSPDAPAELAELHPDPAYRLGERGGHTEPGRPADRQHRGVLGRRTAQRRDSVTPAQRTSMTVQWARRLTRSAFEPIRKSPGWGRCAAMTMRSAGISAATRRISL